MSIAGKSENGNCSFMSADSPEKLAALMDHWIRRAAKNGMPMHEFKVNLLEMMREMERSGIEAFLSQQRAREKESPPQQR